MPLSRDVTSQSLSDLYSGIKGLCSRYHGDEDMEFGMMLAYRATILSVRDAVDERCTDNERDTAREGLREIFAGTPYLARLMQEWADHDRQAANQRAKHDRLRRVLLTALASGRMDELVLGSGFIPRTIREAATSRRPLPAALAATLEVMAAGSGVVMSRRDRDRPRGRRKPAPRSRQAV